tara:strand:- start:4683 stop:6200 length:1518 start_codon:yes stop_codon:yes gene_type:complete
MLGRVNFVLFSIILFIFSVGLKNFSIYLLYRKIFNFIYSVESETSIRLLKEYLKRPYLFFINTNSGFLINNLTQEIYKFNDVLLNSFFLINELFLFFGIILILMFVSPETTIFLSLIFVFFGIIFVKIYKNKQEKLGKELVGYDKKRIKILNEIFNSIKDLILYEAKNFFAETYKNNLSGSVRIRGSQSVLRNLPKLFIETFVIFAICLILFYSVSQNIDFNLFLPQIGLFVISAIRLIPSVTKAAYAFQILTFGKETVSILNNEINQIEELKNKEENIQVLKLNNTIELKNIKFSYDRSKSIHYDFDINIKKNSFTGIVGKSGTGKTTLLNIILGLVPINSGSLLIDKLDISNKEKLLSGWRQNIGYVPQSIYLLDDTLKANIAFGVKENEINLENLNRAIEYSKVNEFIKDWPDGYDTIIGEKGGKVSGGQLQRIGIARALYNNPDIIILDEATSALDENLERKIIEILYDLKKIKTIIIVTHRSTNLYNCDQIIDLNKIKNV